MNIQIARKFLVLIPLVALMGCSKNPADDVAQAKTGAAGTVTEGSAATTPAAGDRTFAFGPNGSAIEFVGSKVTGSHNGGFKNFAGEFHVAGGRVADSGNKVVIDTGSLWADNDKLTGHLKSPDFFNAAQFPTATLVTTAVQQQETNATVTGNLTLHGVTKQISFPAKIQVTDSAVDVQAEFSINRFDFEIKYPGKTDDLIRKEVVLKLKAHAAPGKADFAPLESRPAGSGPQASR